jgi:hypothetical protein
MQHGDTSEQELFLTDAFKMQHVVVVCRLRGLARTYSNVKFASARIRALITL